MRDFCQKRLAAYKLPRTIEFWESLPKNATGKILKREIKRLRITTQVHGSRIDEGV
ncbi:hypothetical protein HY793_01665 [Candidatus Desantisbacteria bacterium]|nr:hypothetical protein [Candidatus Desantisbacteria bacterium]